MAMWTEAETVQQPTAEFPYFTEEHDLIRQTVTEFCKKEIAPYAAEWDEAGIFPREFLNKAGALGMVRIRIDPMWGGSGQHWSATAPHLESLRASDTGAVNISCPLHPHMTIPLLHAPLP